ncbi:unnamed protein product [Sympodiomycopsis kandeliae]
MHSTLEVLLHVRVPPHLWPKVTRTFLQHIWPTSESMSKRLATISRHLFLSSPRTIPRISRQMSTYAAAPANWSRFVRFIAQEDGQEHMGEPIDKEVNVADTTTGPIKVTELLGPTPWEAQRSDQTLTIKQILCPLKPNEVNTIRCIGLNYSDHAKEANIPLPEQITLFMKPRTALTGPGDVIVPKCVQDESSDYESELCVVLGKDCKDVSEEEALDYVLAYTASNDISARKAQWETSQWSRSKGFDFACPVGPALVSPKNFERSATSPLVQVTGKLNGKTRQSAPTSNLVFSVAKIISFLSKGTTLERGSIILTGTPAGVGTFDKPMTYLKDGDVFEVEISGGIGALRNTIVYEK